MFDKHFMFGHSRSRLFGHLPNPLDVDPYICVLWGGGEGGGGLDFWGYFSDIVNSLTGGNTSYHTGYRDAGVKNSTRGI